MSALAALAERPALIERMFVTKEYSSLGLYELRISKNGEWHNVIIDDYIPCYPNGGPLFSSTNDNSIWVLLLEKAYAKLHGGYKTLTGGVPSEALMDLTGVPTTSFNFKDAKVRQMVESGKFWELIKHFKEEGYTLVGATPA